MKVKKYVAPTMPEAMNQIRKDLGSDAVILNSREVNNGGFLGFFKKRSIEVVAAHDPQPIPIPPKSTESVQTQPVFKETIVEKDKMDTDVLSEIKHLKKLVELQSKQEFHYKPDYQVAYHHLLNQEVSDNLAREFIDAVIEKHETQKIDPIPDQLFRDVQLEIEKRLSALSFKGVTYTKKIIHFVGPTGVGKTTTLAKVAANSVLNEKKKVAFITTDTYRIAAIEQLKKYARILDVPLEVAYNLKDYQTAIEKFAAYDLILVDTAGRNFRDEQYVQELKSNLDFNGNIETYLVLSLTAKPKDIQEIHEQFHHLAIKELIFTKVDETRQYGSILNTALNNQVGIAYMTNGQDVPDDLIRPSPELISNYIVGENRDA